MKFDLFLGSFLVIFCVLSTYLLLETEAAARRRTKVQTTDDKEPLLSSSNVSISSNKYNHYDHAKNAHNKNKTINKHGKKNGTKKLVVAPIVIKYYTVVKVADGDTATVEEILSSKEIAKAKNSSSNSTNPITTLVKYSTSKLKSNRYSSTTTTTTTKNMKTGKSNGKYHNYTDKKKFQKHSKYGKKKSEWKKRIRVRFLCIDAPEKSQGKWGEWSLTNMSALLPVGTKVGLIGSQTDLYNRTVAELVNHKGVNVNKRIVEMGLAVHYRFQRGCDAYKTIEAKAKKTKKGVWSDRKFVMPWDYRKKNGIGARGDKNFSKNRKNTKHHHRHDSDRKNHKSQSKNKHQHHHYKHENAKFPALSEGPRALPTKKSRTTINAWSTHKPK